MSHTLYSIALGLLMPVVLGRLFWRGFANPGYRNGWGERFGELTLKLDSRAVVWVHAVSVGEAQAAAPVIDALLKQRPELQVLVTTTTPTGRQRLTQLFGDAVAVQFIPYDLPFAVRRFLRATRPQLVVVMETEIWPNLLRECVSARVPTVLINARLSARSAARYLRFATFSRTIINAFSAIGAQGTADAERLRSLGATVPILVTGSIKFDVNLAPSVLEGGQALRRQWGSGRSVLIGASTHEGEEELLLDAFAKVREKHPDCLLVLVPRHPERFQRAAALARKRGLSTALRTEQRSDCQDVDVYVGDTMGELPQLYAGADVAFVGGSLVNIGGHNMLEPAALGLPVLFGPYLHNFADISEALCDAGAAVIVGDADTLAAHVGELFTDGNARHARGERGREFVAANRGALQRSTDLLWRYLPDTGSANTADSAPGASDQLTAEAPSG
ncbi:MAG: lipid IV(A) 3-deoxy-D-manno-octulosonic acid transferase [Pseudomonadota bacterium]